MAKIHGVAGEWARVKGTVLGMWPLFLGFAGLGFAVATGLFVSTGAGLIALAVTLVWIGATLMRGLRRVERFFKGARGEEKVSGILKALPEGYHVFNDFVAKGSHVDHVVAGPAGVYAVETKFWRGPVTIEDGHILVDGQLPSRPPLAQARKEAGLVKATLAAAGWDGEVTPVVAFASDTFDAGIAELQGAVIINACELRAAFGTKRTVIPPAELDRLISLMENK